MPVVNKESPSEKHRDDLQPVISDHVQINSDRTSPWTASVCGAAIEISSWVYFRRQNQGLGDSVNMSHQVLDGQVVAVPYNWPHDASLNACNTALVIIDMQRDFCEPGGYLDAQGYGVNLQPIQDAVNRIKELLDAWREHGLPVYHTREGHRPDLSTLSNRELVRSRNNPSGLGIGDKGPLGRLLVRGEPGHDIVKELSPRANEPVIDKPGRSAFAHTDFELLLRIKGIKNLVLCGVTTDVCVSSTMRDANDRAFDCLLVEDCTVASEEALCKGALDSVRAEGGIFGATAKLEDVLRAISVLQRIELHEIHGYARTS